MKVTEIKLFFNKDILDDCVCNDPLISNIEKFGFKVLDNKKDIDDDYTCTYDERFDLTEETPIGVVKFLQILDSIITKLISVKTAYKYAYIKKFSNRPLSSSYSYSVYIAEDQNARLCDSLDIQVLLSFLMNYLDNGSEIRTEQFGKEYTFIKLKDKLYKEEIISTELDLLKI
jgi:hypothetical protein